MPLLRTLAALGILVLAAPAPASPALERGDALWGRRAEGQTEAQARPEPIGAAVESYLEAHWKLQRALWFAGYFATRDRDAERRLYEEAIAIGEDSLRVLASRAGGK